MGTINFAIPIANKIADLILNNVSGVKSINIGHIAAIYEYLSDRENDLTFKDILPSVEILVNLSDNHREGAGRVYYRQRYDCTIYAHIPINRADVEYYKNAMNIAENIGDTIHNHPELWSDGEIYPNSNCYINDALLVNISRPSVNFNIGIASFEINIVIDASVQNYDP